MRNRVQIDLSEESSARLEKLRERGDSASKAEVIRKALRALELLSDYTEQGAKLQLPDGRTVEIVVL